MTARITIRSVGLHSIAAIGPGIPPTHLLGILDPPTPEPAIYDHDPHSAPRPPALPGHRRRQPAGPTAEHAEQIIAFADQVRSAHARTPARLLVTVTAGISRSTAERLHHPRARPRRRSRRRRVSRAVADHDPIPGRTAASYRSPTASSAPAPPAGAPHAYRDAQRRSPGVDDGVSPLADGSQLEATSPSDGMKELDRRRACFDSSNEGLSWCHEDPPSSRACRRTPDCSAGVRAVRLGCGLWRLKAKLATHRLASGVQSPRVGITWKESEKIA